MQCGPAGGPGSGEVGLARRVRAGEAPAHGEAYRRHAGDVAMVAWHAGGGDPGTAEDAVQEVFLELWRRPERFQPDRGSLGTYLRTMTRARVVDRHRSDTARRRREAVVPGAGGEDVEAAVAAALTAAAVRVAIARLPGSEREAIELAYFGGRSYRQAAAELGQPEGTVKSRIRSGLRQLRVDLRAELGADA